MSVILFHIPSHSFLPNPFDMSELQFSSSWPVTNMATESDKDWSPIYLGGNVFSLVYKFVFQILKIVNKVNY